MKKQLKHSFICPFCKKKQTGIIKIEKAQICYYYDFETQEHKRGDEDFEGNEGYFCPNCDKKIDYNLIEKFYE